MVKLKSKQRLQDLQRMLTNAKAIGVSLPKIELEYKKLKSRQLKGNKELFRF